MSVLGDAELHDVDDGDLLDALDQTACPVDWCRARRRTLVEQWDHLVALHQRATSGNDAEAAIELQTLLDAARGTPS